MAYTFLVNQTPATGAVAMYQLISTLMTAGWLKKMDSDGTTYSATGVQITSGASGTNGLGNNNAWVRLQSPTTNGGTIVDQTREITIQRGSSDTGWRIKYSAHGKFVGGVPNAISTPINETSGAYSEINQSGTTSLNNTVFGAGQSFVGNGSILKSARFWLKKATTPTGQVFIRVYAHSGVFGTSSIPTGAVLAVSEPLDVSTLTTSYVLTDFKFTGANQITLTNATNYVITVEYTTGTAGATLDVGTDTSAPTDPGNLSTFSAGNWTATAGTDVCFFVLTGIQDEVIMLGTGSDATPTFSASWFTTNGAYRWHIACGGADENYSFIVWAAIIGTGNASVCLALDVLSDGSYSSLDVDPAVVYCSATSVTTTISELMFTTFASSNVANPAKARAWLGPVSSAGVSLISNNVNVSIVPYGSNQIGNAATLGSNPWTHNDDLLPCFWGSANVIYPRGLKGTSSLLRFGTIHRRLMTTCDTVSEGSRDKVFFNGFWLPWSGDLPII